VRSKLSVLACGGCHGHVWRHIPVSILIVDHKPSSGRTRHSYPFAGVAWRNGRVIHHSRDRGVRRSSWSKLVADIVNPEDTLTGSRTEMH
jgi:hypothetical protein